MDFNMDMFCLGEPIVDMIPFYSPEGISSFSGLFMYFTIMPLAFIASSAFVAKYVWKPYWTKCQNEPPETYIVPFEYRYPMDEATDTATKLPSIHTYVMECSPEGQIVLRYNKKDEHFEYWGSLKITYTQLETMARKYITMNQCSRIFIDYEGEMLKEKERLEKEEKEKDQDDQQDHQEKEKKDDQQNQQDDQQEENEPSVFVSFKSYNDQDKITQQKSLRASKKVKKNHYSHRGTVNDFFTNICMSNPTEKEKETVKSIDFSTYKKLFCKI